MPLLLVELDVFHVGGEDPLAVLGRLVDGQALIEQFPSLCSAAIKAVCSKT